MRLQWRYYTYHISDTAVPARGNLSYQVSIPLSTVYNVSMSIMWLILSPKAVVVHDEYIDSSTVR